MTNLLKRILRRIEAIVYKPRLQVERRDVELQRLGSAYGGWVFVRDPALRGATIISCGLGEDASFDVEFARAHSARVALVDPTPRAIAHFAALSARLGQPAERAYTNDGALPAESYDLRDLEASTFTLAPKALWKERGMLRFFAPPNPDYVSHSLVNFQNNYREDTQYIEVEALAIDELLGSLGLSSVPLIKLDIEGAEIEVLADMMAKRVFPGQILVEYDELNVPSSKSRDRVQSTHELLLRNGYVLVNFERPSNATYLRVDAGV